MKLTKAKGLNPKSVMSTDGKLTVPTTPSGGKKSVMSTDGKLAVPTTPSGGKKPGQRKRQICNVHGWKTYSTNNTIRWEKPGQRKRQINAKTFSLSRTKKAKL